MPNSNIHNQHESISLKQIIWLWFDLSQILNMTIPKLMLAYGALSQALFWPGLDQDNYTSLGQANLHLSSAISIQTNNLL